MEEISRYILSVVAAALILGILGDLIGKSGTTPSLLRLAGGLFLAFVIISPAAKMDFSGIDDFFEAYSDAGSAIAASGEDHAQENRRGIIKEQVEAYILDKADSLQADLTAEAVLSAGALPVPTAVRLRGSISPYAKAQLQEMIEEDLGIAKENQLWIG